MKKIRSFSLLKNFLSSPKFLGFSLIIALVYAFFIELLFQTKIVLNIIQFPVSILDKGRLIALTILANLASLNTFDLLLLMSVSLLVGINIALVRKKVSFISKQKNLKLTFGAGILSVAGAGCTSCGFSVMTILGLGGAVSFLPLKGLEFSFLAIFVLLLTMLHSLNSMAKSCKTI